MAIASAASVGLRTIVLCLHEEWLNQWKSRIQQNMSSNVKIGWTSNEDVCEWQDCDVVLMFMSCPSHCVTIIHSAALTCGLVIVDEVHHVSCKSYIQALCKIRHRFSLGLTATPKKHKELNKRIEWMIGEPCCKIERLPDQRVQVNMISYSLGRQREILTKEGNKHFAVMVTLLTKDAVRNRLLLDVIRLLFRSQPNRKGLLLSERVEHLKVLHRQLDPAICAVITHDIHTEMSKKERAARKRLRQELRFEKFITLSTYQMFGEATDFDGDFVILASPKADAEQSTGRIMRGRTLAHSPVIIDVVDPFSCFDIWRWNRLRFYQKMDYDILHLTEQQIFSAADRTTQ